MTNKMVPRLGPPKGMSATSQLFCDNAIGKQIVVIDPKQDYQK